MGAPASLPGLAHRRQPARQAGRHALVQRPQRLGLPLAGPHVASGALDRPEPSCRCSGPVVRRYRAGGIGPAVFRAEGLYLGRQRGTAVRRQGGKSRCSIGWPTWPLMRRKKRPPSMLPVLLPVLSICRPYHSARLSFSHSSRESLSIRSGQWPQKMSENHHPVCSTLAAKLPASTGRKNGPASSGKAGNPCRAAARSCAPAAAACARFFASFTALAATLSCKRALRRRLPKAVPAVVRERLPAVIRRSRAAPVGRAVTPPKHCVSLG